MAEVQLDIADFISGTYADPLAFVVGSFPWGQPGTPLEHFDGPDKWQEQLLIDLGEEVRARAFDGHTPVKPIRMAVGSGHSVGKSAVAAWIHWWIMCTRPGSKGRVTANTRTQLEIVTWAEIQKWHKLLICKDWFDINQSGSWAKSDPTGWFSSVVTCSPENSEAFAGQHNITSTSFYIFDESSLIEDVIWDVADGGLLDGESMHFAFGNVTRNTGNFYEALFGKKAHRWIGRSIDSRTCKFPNHVEQQEWIDDYGLDSDYVRVRVLGLAARTAETQFIGRGIVEEAQNRKVQPLPEDPLIAGVDVPDGGSAWFVIRFRRGLDARPTPQSEAVTRRATYVPPPIRVAGSKTDRTAMVAMCATVLNDTRPGHKVAAMFIDSGFGAAIFEALKSKGYWQVTEVRFGGPSPHHEYANMRAYMWGMMRDWLEKGAIDRNDTELGRDLMAPGFKRRLGGDGAIVLESKEEMKARGILDVDDADALALSWAMPVPQQEPEQQGMDEEEFGQFSGRSGGGWMGR